MQVHLHRSDELVALPAGVLAHGRDELALERPAEVGEAVEVLGGQKDVELVGDDEAVDTDRAAEIHLACEPPAQLDGLELAAERLGKRAFDQTLEATLELLQSHGANSLPVR